MSKSLTEFQEQLNEYTSFSVQYGSDYKLEPNGRGGYRKVRARRIKVGDKAPDPSQIDAPEVGDDNAQFSNSTVDIYKKFRRKYLQVARQSQNTPAVNPKTVEESVENIEIKEISEEQLEEAKKTKSKSSDKEPPFVLVLKRQNIRMYPKGLKVALYYSDTIGKYFTVPYGPGVSPNDPSIQAESVESSLLNSEQKTMESILKLYSELSEDNQQTLLKMVSEDYSKVKEFINTLEN